MNEEKYHDKEIKTICDYCGEQDGYHACKCGAEINAAQCERHEGMCQDCI